MYLLSKLALLRWAVVMRLIPFASRRIEILLCSSHRPSISSDDYDALGVEITGYAHTILAMNDIRD
jgi:hypothetical protein